MTLIPEFEIGLWNGWILSAIFMVSNYLLLFAPKAKQNFKEMMDQVKRLKDENKKLNTLAYILQYGIYFYSIFISLKIYTSYFYIGLALFILGITYELIAVTQLFFRKPGQLITKGLYRFSRNPQYVGWSIVCVGIGIATASWVILVLAVFSTIVNHYIVQVEEQICLQKYGDSYRNYIKKTPKYIKIPKLKK